MINDKRPAPARENVSRGGTLGDELLTKHTLKRQGETDLEFIGQAVAGTTSYPGRNDRWTEIQLYRTRGNNWVWQKIGRSKHDNESDIYSAGVAQIDAELIRQLGTGWLAKQLYDAVSIKVTTWID